MVQKCIRIFSSVRLAAVLIILLAVLCLMGIFLPQITAEFSSTADGYSWWIQNIAYKQLGNIVYTPRPLGVFNIFHSFWFIATTALLMLNILFCTLSRIKKLVSETQKIKINDAPDFYERNGSSYELRKDVSASQAADAAQKELERHYFSLIRTKNDANIYLAGSKNRFTPFGTLFVHLSLLLLIIGIVAGVFFGFRNNSFVVAETASGDIGYGTGLSVFLKSFTDVYWEDGSPKNYSSDVDIYENSVKVKSGTISVNHPMKYKGVRIHQGYFGPAAGIHIAGEDGKTILQEGVALSNMRLEGSLHRPEGKVSIPGNDYTVILLGSAVNGTDTDIGPDQMGVEFYDADMKFIGWLLLNKNIPQQLGSLTFSYENLQYSGFLISKDPGAAFFWIAAILFLTGLAMIFYFPRRQVWVRILSFPENRTKIWMQFKPSKDNSTDNESMRIIKALGFEEKEEGSH